MSTDKNEVRTPLRRFLRSEQSSKLVSLVTLQTYLRELDYRLRDLEEWFKAVQELAKANQPED